MDKTGKNRIWYAIYTISQICAFIASYVLRLYLPMNLLSFPDIDGVLKGKDGVRERNF